VTLWTLAAVAFGADSIVAVQITAPDGSNKLTDEIPVVTDQPPVARMLVSPDGKYAVKVTVAPKGEGAAVELVAGKAKDDEIVPKTWATVDLKLWAEGTGTLAYKKDTWTVKATLGQVWDAPEPGFTDDPQRYVLAWDDASLYPQLPDKKAKKKPVVVKERELPGGRTDVHAQASPMRFVAVPDGDSKMLQLESVLTPDRSHCQLGGPSTDKVPTQYFVGLPDMVQRVTAREVVGKLSDGTGYRVAAGVPVVEEGEGKFRVNTGGLSFLIEGGKDDIGVYYRPSPHFDSLGEHPLSVGAGVIGATALGEVTWAGPDALPVAGVRGVGTPRVTFRVPCAEVRVAPAAGWTGASN
jgi:hypothetical protein